MTDFVAPFSPAKISRDGLVVFGITPPQALPNNAEVLRFYQALTEKLHSAVAELLPPEYLPDEESSYSSPITRTSVSSHTPNRS